MGGLGRTLRDPVRVTSLVQTAKTALAAGLAWWVGTSLWHLSMPFLAPWAAVLVVHSTVYRTLTRGTQQVLATFFAVFLAFAFGSVLGATPIAIGLVVLVGYLLGQVRWIRDEAGTIATTGLVTLATGSISQPHLLLSRLVDTSTGIVVGLAVNLVIWPPLRDRAAWARAERLPREIAGVLRTMAEELGPDIGHEQVDGWVKRLRVVDLHVDEAWALLWQGQESGRFNPRRSKPTGIEDLKRLLHLVEAAVADVMSMARTVAASAEDERAWGQDFRDQWVELTRRTADAVDGGDVEELESAGHDIDGFISELAESPLHEAPWQEYGGLLTNLRNTHRSLTELVGFEAHTGLADRRSSRYPA